MADECALPMTPMIDVVFQLLIFFLFSIKPEDVVSQLDVSRPQPDPTKPPIEKVDDMLTISVFADGVTLNGRAVSMSTLDNMLTRLAALSQTQTVLIKCAADSRHESLVRILDLCAKSKLTNLSVLSL